MGEKKEGTRERKREPQGRWSYTSRIGFRMRRVNGKIDGSFCAVCCSREEIYFCTQDMYKNIFYIAKTISENSFIFKTEIDERHIPQDCREAGYSLSLSLCYPIFVCSLRDKV